MKPTQKLRCDFLVGGAGISGICAAVQGGRLGLKTILVEKEMILGGNGGPNLGVGAHACMSCNPYWNEMGIMEELEERVNYHRARMFPTNFGYNLHPQWDQVVTEMLEEAGVTVLRRHLIHGVEVADGKIARIQILNIENLNNLEIEIDGYVLDATGDAFIADLAGADCRMGREAQIETGERSAPDAADDIISTASVTALVVDSGTPCAFDPPEGTPPWNPEKPDNHFDPGQRIHFLWQVDEGGESKENHSLYTPQELYRKLVFRIYSVWNYLKNIKFPAEAKNHQLIWISPILGKRESRRVLGDYLLTETDIEECKTFPDSVGFGGSFLDEHLPSYDGGYEVRFYVRPLPYDIPLRSLFSRNIQNLFSGGRAIGVSHLAFTSTRLMRTGGVLGQAAAVAAKMCIERGITPRELANRFATALQQELLKQDNWIIGVPAKDPKDLTRGAVVVASSQAELSCREPGDQWRSAGNGIAAALYDYPHRVEKIGFYIKNNHDRAVEVKAILGYGETPPIELYEVPGIFYNEETKRYEEMKTLVHNAESHQDVVTQPTGSQGWAHYCKREDNVTSFQEVCSAVRMIAPRFQEWVEFNLTNEREFPSFCRKIAGQAVVIALEGDVEVSTSPIKVDVMAGLIRSEKGWSSDYQRIPSFKITPDPVPGSAANILDGHIHREARAHLHQWMSSPTEELPQWIQLEWQEEKTIGTVQLRFDVTERLWKDMYLIKGERAAGRCVADYRVEILADGKWDTIISEKDNYLRFRKHKLAQPVKAKTVRLTVDRVWDKGQPTRVYAIELYE